MKREQPGMLIYFDLVDNLSNLTDEEFGEMIRAAATLVRDEVTPVFRHDINTIYWPFVWRAVWRDKERYQEKVDRERRKKDPEYAKAEALMEKYGGDSPLS